MSDDFLNALVEAKKLMDKQPVPIQGRMIKGRCLQLDFLVVFVVTISTTVVIVVVMIVGVLTASHVRRVKYARIIGSD